MQLPRWSIPLLKPARYKAAHGGRGGSKSHTFVTLLILALILDPNKSAVIIREVQKSIKQSVKRLVEQKIRDLEVGDYFEITSTEIRSRHGTGVIVFVGMQDHTAESIKSLEGFDIALVEEAQPLSQRSLDLLRPTIRKPGSEIWLLWNPIHETDPVDVFMRGPDAPKDAIVIEVNYEDNPWFPDTLRAEVVHDQRVNLEKFEWIWRGKYLAHAEARYFKNWHIEDFEAPADAQFRFGLDWGYSDPLAFIRCFIVGRKLFVDHEAYEIECKIRETPGLLLTVPEAEKHEIVAGSDRPERIDDLLDRGFRKIRRAVRGPNSVEQGLEWLQDYEIIVHPRCRHLIDELRLFSHPVDRITGKVLTGYVDENNHLIEALRYACEAVRRFALENADEEKYTPPPPMIQHWGRLHG